MSYISYSIRSMSYRLLRNRLTLPYTPFYRQYPYRNGVSINSADSRGCVDTELGFFCNRIPKAANSTVITNLAKFKLGRDILSKHAKKLFRHPSQLSAEEVAALNTLFQFTVVRNPYTRTLSAYLEKVELRFAKGRKVESSFSEFLNSLINGKLYSNAHWAPQNSLLLLPLEEFDFIGKVETLEEDMAYIRGRILKTDEASEPIKSFRPHATGANEKLKHYYDESSIEIVRNLFREDFELFGYPLDFPRARSD